MNTQEACNILGINIGADEAEVKKAFREKAAKLHPDVNKESDAEQKFKQINEAYQLLTTHGTKQQPFTATGFRPQDVGYDPTDHFAQELFRRMNNDFGSFFVRNEIHFSLDITFEESILGCTKELRYKRKKRCDHCVGLGVELDKKNICQKCEGKGRRQYGSGDGPLGDLPCTSCKGKGFLNSHSGRCAHCNANGFIDSEEVRGLVISPGIFNGNVIPVHGGGNFNKQTKNYGIAMVTVNVLKDKDMTREGFDVISIIRVTLLEALQGTKKKVRTVRGDKKITLPAKLKNRDVVRVAGFGVPGAGAHNFIVEVDYPEDVGPLIEALTPKPEPIVQEPPTEEENKENGSGI